MLTAFGCSDNPAGYFDNDVYTLKNLINEKSESVLWSKEIEGSLLVKNLSVEPSAGRNHLSPSVINILQDYNTPLYPFIDGFGYLYENNLVPEVYKKLEGFCNSVSDYIYKGPEKYVDSTYIFSYVLFLQDIKEGWKKNLKKDFPVQQYSDAEYEEKKKADAIDRLFERWLFGAVFETDDYYEIPVRFFSNDGIIDVVLTFNKSNDSKIIQIEISNWEVVNAR